ncbi:DGQHR domain-containing protein [Fusobacterium varium]|jgi:DGQHR domain-containing protein
MKLNLLKISQPIGEFFISSIKAKELVDRVVIKRRKDFHDGVQRTINEKRIKEIADYTKSPDATFPTSLIIAGKDVIKEKLIQKEGTNIYELNLEKNEKIGELIDGQHRYEGLKNSDNIEEFELPIVLMFDLREEGKAYVFSTINSKQVKIDPSLIYDLFELSENRSPQKTCHEIARLMNQDEKSPFYQKLKMLGKKNRKEETLSQGTFIKKLIKLITKNEDADLRTAKRGENFEIDTNLPLRQYFIEKKDEYIYKILVNLFNGLKNVYPDEWENSILVKTLGYGGVMEAFKHIFEIGQQEKDLTEYFFENGFRNLPDILEEKGKKLSDFISGAKHEQDFAKLIKKSFELEYGRKNLLND